MTNTTTGGVTPTLYWEGFHIHLTGEPAQAGLIQLVRDYYATADSKVRASLHGRIFRWMSSGEDKAEES